MLITYIVISVVCFVCSIVCGWLTYYCFKHRYSNYVIEALNWYKSFWYKNRHTFLLMITIVLVITAFAFVGLAIAV